MAQDQIRRNEDRKIELYQSFKWSGFVCLENQHSQSWIFITNNNHWNQYLL